MKKKRVRPKKVNRSDALRRKAEARLQESSDKLEAWPEKDLKGLVHELQVHQVELEMQNEELRRAQVELEESRNRYFELYNLAPAGYFTLERNGLILEANLTASRLLGTERRHLEKRLFSRFIHRDDQGIFFSHIKLVLENGKNETCELRLVTEEDTITYVRMESAPVSNGIGDVIQIRSVLSNITQRKQAELDLKESEERFRLIAETNPDIIFQLDPRGVILYCSPSLKKILGYRPDEVKGNPIDKYLSPSDVPEAREYFQRLLFGEKTEAFQLNVLTKSGTPVPFELAISAFVEVDKVKFIFGIARDITDRKKAEEELKKREEHLRLAVEGGNLGTWERDLITGETFWNPLLYDFLGRDQSRSITGETMFEYIHKDDLPHVRENLEKGYQSGKEFVDEFRIVREDGEVRWLAGFGRIYRDQVGEPILIAGVNLDITDRKHNELELRKYRKGLEEKVKQHTEELSQRNKELLEEVRRRKRYEEELRDSAQKILQEVNRRRYLSRRLVETLERDRRDVAMYLHDQIGQMLVTLRMDLEMMRRGISRGSGVPKEKLLRVEDKVSDIVMHSKNISRRLRPDILDSLGLVPALRSLVESFRGQTGVRIHFYYKEPSQKVDPDRSLAVYRIAQEALNNVRKHAQANEVFLNLIMKNDSILLTIEDDGIGFDYEETVENVATEGSLGIMIMKERVALVGGEFRVESEIGKGTHVVAEIPLG
jgi:PAS domain S-box-containing protein